MLVALLFNSVSSYFLLIAITTIIEGTGRRSGFLEMNNWKDKNLVFVFLLLASAPNAVAETPGQALFAQKCTSCHSEARVARKLREKISGGERIPCLERMLPNHYVPDAKERSLIVEYLALKMAE
jgi:hypothetical protein